MKFRWSCGGVEMDSGKLYVDSRQILGRFRQIPGRFQIDFSQILDRFEM